MRPGTPLTPHDRRRTIAAVVALAWYVTSWAVAGLLEPGYDPTQQAISELFDLDASPVSRLLLSSGLLVSAVGLVVFGRVLHRRLPGTAILGPAAIVGSGVATGVIVAFPCTAGCPGIGTTWLDTGHSLAATIGYALLLLGPLLIGLRVRGPLPTLARWSFLLGGTAVAVFVLGTTGISGAGWGLTQRVFNTVADVWYVVAAVWLLRGRHLPADRRTSDLVADPGHDPGHGHGAHP